jgi:hypothetical protein
MRKTIRLCVAFCAVFVVTVGRAQQSAKPNYSGTWNFNPSRSELQVPVPTSAVFELDHREPVFRMKRTFVTDGKTETWSIDLSTDGKEVLKEEAGSTTRGRIFWEGNLLVYEATISMNGRTARDVVRYELSEDGKILTATERFRGPVVKYDNLWIFEK